MRHPTIAFLALLAPLAAQAPSPFVDRYLTLARGLQDEGKLGEARAAAERALERDRKSLPALRLAAELALADHDLDTAVHALHSWRSVVEAAARSPVPRTEQKEVLAQLRELDPRADDWDALRDDYVSELLKLGKDYKRRKDMLAALEVLSHVLEVDPDHRGARAQMRAIRRTGGAEVAVEDVFAGADPGLGKTPAQIAAEDAVHREWPDAWTKDGENYRYRTDAGYLVLETSAIAMEQMNRFYRRFFRYKEDGGKTPKIEIRIFKSRDEYLQLGADPVEWSAGHFIGSAVETYVGGVTGKESIRDMYRTLFHEAAHQFVSLTGPGVPGWLNEAYASFFEGCVILSNGSVKWNRVPAGRLFPLADRMEKGWMHDAADGIDGASSKPERAPTFRIVVQGDYAWGPPWYAPTWGVVYFLYNYRTEDGRAVYRDALHTYYESFKRGRPKDPIAHFEEVVLRGAPLSPVQSIDQLDPIWRQWILQLRDRLTGKSDSGAELVRFGDAALERGDKKLALQFYDEAHEGAPNDVDLTWKLARLLEDLGDRDRAAATYRELKRELELRGDTDGERYATATKKVTQLDPLARRYQRIKAKLAEAGIALARSYEARRLPTMALEIARRMTAGFSSPEALAYYIDLAKRTGKTLARWRLAYDESSLQGWSGGDGAYAAYGERIRARVEGGAAGGDGALLTRQLTCDVTFDTDFSLSAEMRIDGDGHGGYRGSLMGLCFGRKGDQNFHAVVLHPSGFLDVATDRGGSWEILDHRGTPVGDRWHRLRIDVTGRTLDVYLDGFYVRALEFPSRETVQGSFGLITGAGEASYKNIRVLSRDSFDPAAAIERQLAMARIQADASLRQPGTFAGGRPPALAVGAWLQGEPVTLEALAGHPVVLAFWSPAQERVIPTAALYADLLARGKDKGAVLVVVCDAGTGRKALAAYLAEHPIPGAHVAIDSPANAVFEAYYVKAGHHGMPRVLLLDRDGIVCFEGDPGLKSGVGWKPGQETYLDAPFEKILR